MTYKTLETEITGENEILCIIPIPVFNCRISKFCLGKNAEPELITSRSLATIPSNQYQVYIAIS